MQNSEKNISKKQNYFTLLDYIKIFIRHKKFLIYSSIITAAIAAFIMFFIVKPIFLSSGIVKSTTESSNLAGLLSASGLSGLADVGDLAGGGAGASELALYEQILTSRRCIEQTIIKFNLMEVMKEKFMQDAVKDFRESTLELNKDKIAGTLEIGVYDEEPQRAKDIVNFLISQLNSIYTEMTVANAKNNREFIEKRHLLVKSDLKKAEDSLKTYQDVYGIAPDIIAKSVVQSSVQLEAEIKSEEVKLELLSKIFNQDQSEIKLQEEKIKALKKQLFDINNKPNSGNEYLSLKDAPSKVINYLRLQREVEIQNKILAFILPIYEQAKIDEKKDTPVVLVLDQPFIPERKAKPKRLTVTAIITLVWFGGAYSFFFFYDKFRDFKKNIA